MEITNDRPSRVITVADAAHLLKVSPRRVRALIQAGRLPAERIGRDWLIKAIDLWAVETRAPGRPKKGN
jgi:excisionase family DNA binding protein